MRSSRLLSILLRLQLRGRVTAAELAQQIVAGERVLLLIPPGLDYIAAYFGCLYAGVVAVPTNLPRPNRPMPRLRAIVADAKPRAVLTTRRLLPDSNRWIAEAPAACISLTSRITFRWLP